MVGLVWAQAANGVIGHDGALPWHLPEDLARFRALTVGTTVVMGRATWESLPARFRPLPDRDNVVLSRDGRYVAPGGTVVGSLADALAHGTGDVWVIGGATVYAQALVHADRLAVTELAEAFDGDAYAPDVGDGWDEVTRLPRTGWATSRTGLRYRFRDLVRARDAAVATPGSQGSDRP
jgi:dihydrofolate reductase